MACRILAIKPEGKRLLEDLDVDVTVILRWGLEKEIGAL
jgi:hypothetical protein